MNEPLTPEEYQALLQAGVSNAELDAIMQMQMAQANQLRTGAPEMRGNSRVQMAPHWLEMVGGLARNKVAGDKEQAALATKKQMVQNTGNQNQLLLKALMSQAGGVGTGGTGEMPQPPAQQPYTPFMFGSKT